MQYLSYIKSHMPPRSLPLSHILDFSQLPSSELSVLCTTPNVTLPHLLMRNIDKNMLLSTTTLITVVKIFAGRSQNLTARPALGNYFLWSGALHKCGVYHCELSALFFERWSISFCSSFSKQKAFYV